MKKYILMLMAAMLSAVSYAMIASGDREVRVSDSQSLVLQSAKSLKSFGVKQGQVGNSPVYGIHKVQGDHDVIITEVPATAEVKYYNRSGYYHNQVNDYAVTEQDGITAIAFDGSDVYIKNPIIGFENGVWVKGTLENDTITLPLGQFLTWYPTRGYGQYITMVDVYDTDGIYRINDTEATEIIYTISGDVITQNGTSATRTLAVAWSDDNSVYSYGSAGGEYETVFTLNSEYAPTPQVLVDLPAGAKVEQWYAKGTNNGEVANVAFVRDEVYISGIFVDFPESWIKGTVNGSTVTFKKLQYLGDYISHPIWATAVDMKSKDMEDIVMAYDAEAKTLTLDANQALVANASDTELNYLYVFYAFMLHKEQLTPLTFDELPYSNDFATGEQWADFKVIDANSDGITWELSNGTARLRYDNYNDDDDWLVAPLLKLEAGKTYKVSLQACCMSPDYPETFEVKAAQEQKANVLSAGLEVMPVTQVTSSRFTNYENTEFAVPEDGYYAIGIHAITQSAKAWYLYIDDFVVEEFIPIEETVDTVEVVLPDGAEAYAYNMTYTDLSDGKETSKPINVAVVGNEVYFQGMSQYLPEAWVMGKMEGSQVTFPANQYMGEYLNYTSFFFFTGDAVFNYDADADSYSAAGEIFGMIGNQYYDGCYKNPVLSRVPEVAGVPSTPTISGIEDTNSGDVVEFNIPITDIDGNEMVASKLSYQFFVDSDATPLEFTTDYFPMLPENMTVIPYSFTDNTDFYHDHIYLNMPHDSWGRLGIQSIYTGAGERNVSLIAWSDGSITDDNTLITGIGEVKSDAERNGAIYNLSGQKVKRAQKGIYVINGRKLVRK